MVLAIDRAADGRASWQFGAGPAAGDKPAFSGVNFGHLSVGQGSATVTDAVRHVQAKADFTLAEAQGRPTLNAKAEGSYDKFPLRATLRAGSAAVASPIELRVQIGRARLAFDGSVTGLLSSFGLQGRYEVSGPSLAAVGEPLRVTLPTTRAFAMKGSLVRDGTHWSTVVQSATVGRSRLAGAFTFDKPPGALPRLAGRLTGPVLWLEDLGPAVGLPSQPAAAAPPSDRALPVREFDLPALRAMNANVVIAIDRLESGSARLQAVQPLSAHLVLNDGVLDINELDAKLAQGHIRGHIQLDGRQRVALWQTQLRANGLMIEQWILQPSPPSRTGGKTPYATGRLGAQVDLRGRGRSTAELLASADGRMLLYWTRGTISHLAVEAAGIDIAQGLGLLIRGDDALPVTCGAADLVVKAGTAQPRVMLVDTRDSTLWVEGSVSLATEQMHLVARVAPKDFSPLTLRTPLHIDGSLNAPKLSLEKAPLLRRLVPAALLALVNPLAGLLPLLDAGDDEARQAIQACQEVMAKR